MCEIILIYPAFTPQSIETILPTDSDDLVLRTSGVILFACAVNLRTEYAIRFAAVGFVIGIALCIYAFYLTSHGRIGNAALFIILCPPSFGAIALDNAGLIGGLIGWFFICVVNAVLYGLVGLGVGRKLQRTRT